MRLEEYLEALHNCPDDRLKEDLGIYDNWPIFLKADFDWVVEYLKESERYKFEEIIKDSRRMIYHFDYAPGTVKLQVFNCIPAAFTTRGGNCKSERGKAESERQLREFNMTIMLHPYQNKKITGISWMRAIAMVAEDIGMLAIRERIPLCMPNTEDWKGFEAVDYSRIVYHEPEMDVTP